ncbi:MAG: DUF2946 family protein [Parvularculaceae bacterium]|nr:hypothetical protein [Parvularculaceae bacterium]
MDRLRFWSGPVRTAVLLAVVLAFALRLITPPGYMIAAADNGGLTITLCGGGTAHQVLTFDPETGDYSNSPTAPQKSGEDDVSSSPCPFALSAAFVTPPGIAPVLASASIGDEPVTLPVASAASLFPVSAPLPPRGPPTLV